MVFTKKTTKTPAVMVETKKISSKDHCCFLSPVFWRVKHILTFVLLVLNTILLIRILCNQVGIEVERVGGRDNYRMVQQIYKSDAFKASQKQQIEQVLQIYQGGLQNTSVTPAATNTTTETPTVTQ